MAEEKVKLTDEELEKMNSAMMTYAGPEQLKCNPQMFMAVYAGPAQMNNGLNNLAPIGFMSMQQQMENAQKSENVSKKKGVYCICPECASEVAATKFCPECGTPLKDAEKYVDCPSCGVRASAENKFCRECGTKLFSDEIQKV